ncbi:MAG: hypothetical protein GY708_09845 [Actinomycetia bacterium]|nr:hypothetical protein [Actinomycetes bacterium]
MCANWGLIEMRRAAISGLLVAVLISAVGVSAPTVSAGQESHDEAAGRPPATPSQSDAPLGYWMLGSDNEVYGFGDARDHKGASVSGPVAIVPSPSGLGYWLVGSNGSVATGGQMLPAETGIGRVPTGQEVTSASATPSGLGLWLFTDAGVVITLGDAEFFGDLSAIALDGPVVASAATPTGRGYLMAAADGGVFTFGDAVYRGSVPAVLPPGVRVAQPVVGISPTPTNDGYWLVAADGGIFAFGDAPFRGSLPGVLPPGTQLVKPVNGMVPYGNGYLMVASDGGIFSFSNLEFLGSLGADPPDAPIVGVAPMPTSSRSLDVPSAGGVFDLNVDGLPGAELWVDTATLRQRSELAAWTTPGPQSVGVMLDRQPLLTVGLVDSVEAADGDFIFAPAILDGVEMLGTRLHLGPSVSLTLNEPVSVHIPLASLGLTRDDQVVVLLSDADGSEVAPTQIVGDELWVDVRHFSWLDFMLPRKLDRILDNMWENPFLDTGDYAQGLLDVERGPLDERMETIYDSMCSRDDLRFETELTTSLDAMLTSLGFYHQVGAGGGYTGGAAGTSWLKQRVEQLAKRDGDRSVSMSDLFSNALDYTNGDVFQALALSHDTLAVAPRPANPTMETPFMKALERILPDEPGFDQYGARYHVFGAAVYAFMFEHAKSNGTAGWFSVKPDTSVALEEAWVSGDIRSDPEEYALDRRGVELGRRLFNLWMAKTGRGSSDQRSLYSAFCFDEPNARLEMDLIASASTVDVGETVSFRIDVEGGYEHDSGDSEAAYDVSILDQRTGENIATVVVPYNGGDPSTVTITAEFETAGAHVLRARATDSVGSLATGSALVVVEAVVPVPEGCERIGYLDVGVVCANGVPKSAGELTLVYVEWENRTTECFTTASTAPWTAEHRGEFRYTSNIDAVRAEVRDVGAWRSRYNLTCLGYGYQDVQWTVTPIVSDVGVRYADAIIVAIGDELEVRSDCRPFGWPDCELAKHGTTGIMNKDQAS